jgi:hypothetical protein
VQLVVATLSLYCTENVFPVREFEISEAKTKVRLLSKIPSRVSHGLSRQPYGKKKSNVFRDNSGTVTVVNYRDLKTESSNFLMKV